MKSLHELLHDAIKQWRGELLRDFPVRADMEVVTADQQKGKRNPEQDWSFYTDLKKVFAIIWEDEKIRTKFETLVSKYWEGEPEKIAYDTLHYLLFHELYHPLEAPFSIKGPKNDNKLIHQAIRRGIIAAEPELTPLKQLLKVSASQNLVKDFILDNRFAIDNRDKQYVRDDIIPTFDFLELDKTAPKTDAYMISRYLYGVFYGPDSIHQLFAEKAQANGVAVAKKTIDALLHQDITLQHSTPVGPYDTHSSTYRKAMNQEQVQAIRSVFASPDRYAGIERMMGVLGPYVDASMSKGRSDMTGEGSGTSPQNILEDILDDLDEDEKDEFIKALQEELDPENEEPPQLPEDEKEEWQSLDVLAMHEFYKKHHPKIEVHGGRKRGETVVVGKRDRWKLSKSQIIGESELSRLNMSYCARFQTKTGLPMLISLGNNMYRLNEYKVETSTVKGIQFVDMQLDIPDVVELYLDSSGSMNHGGLGFNDGSRWDMLSNVTYGFMEAMVQGSQKLKKPCSVRIHNVAMEQVESPLIPVQQFWKGDPEMLRVMFKPDNGYDHENLDIKKYNDGKRRAYVVVTDGDLCLPGRSVREAKKMIALAKDPKNEMMLFEINGPYALGNIIKDEPSIHYYPVRYLDDMLKNGLKVLLSK